MNHQISDKLFLKSALHHQSEQTSVEQVLSWLVRQNNKIEVSVTQCPLKAIKGWSCDKKVGLIKHQSGGFFSIEGINVASNCLQEKWQQPIINQSEVGYLGIITKEINGVLHFLLQAKIEPGNTNHVQLSPTLQATRSNYTRVHKGRIPLYLDYFINAKPEQVLVDQLQSEQGSRFLRKRNRNIIIKITEEIKIHKQFIWLTLSQIKSLMQYDNIVNMDTRSVISCISFGKKIKNDIELETSLIDSRKIDFLKSSMSINSKSTIFQLISFLTNIKSKCVLNIERVKLNCLDDWSIDEMKIFHNENKFFEVIAVDVQINNREVLNWSQPMIAPTHQGLCAFLVKKINGVIHFIVQGKIECGNLDIVEFAPTVQLLTRNYKTIQQSQVLFLQEVLETKKSNIIFDTLQSEEGGRFYQDSNRYMMVMADNNLCEELPDNYTWMTLNQLQTFLKFNNFINVQARSLIAAIEYS